MAGWVQGLPSFERERGISVAPCNIKRMGSVLRPNRHSVLNSRYSAVVAENHVELFVDRGHSAPPLLWFPSVNAYYGGPGFFPKLIGPQPEPSSLVL